MKNIRNYMVVIGHDDTTKFYLPANSSKQHELNGENTIQYQTEEKNI